MRRNIPLITGEYYHVFNKSIFSYIIFNNQTEYQRMLQLIHYYRFDNTSTSFSRFTLNYQSKQIDFFQGLKVYKISTNKPLVRIVSYCLMPTHIHFLLQQLQDSGIQIFLQNIQNGYAQFFNHRHNRRGPLWQNRFKNTHIDQDVGLLRTSLYIHANPVKSLLTDSACQWDYSSYNEYLNENPSNSFCECPKFMNIQPAAYEHLMAYYLQSTSTPPGSITA